MARSKINTDLLSSIIVGRVEPNIYAFTTQTIPNYLKIGDTYRPVHERLSEWKTVFPNLLHIYTHSARIDDDTIFRDLSIHKYLETEKHLQRLRKEDVKPQFFSNEFFKDATTDDIDDAIADIHKSARDKDGRYPLYSSDHLPKTFTYTRGESFPPRENQQEVINNFKTAYRLGRKNLLMYAVMRFGKTFTSMCCAKEMGAGLVLVVSAKADVTDEWKKTVESMGNFEGYIFADKSNLSSSYTFIHDKRQAGNKVVLFLTLQDLQGDEMKEVHREVFDLEWDLLLVDETHFGARAEHYGKVLLNKKEAAAETKRQLEGVDTLDKLDKEIKELRRRVTIHLSGTPYRILMGSEFEKEDIIAFVQFSDIADAQRQWDEEHKYDDKTSEWENPYFGFPQMVRFAFHPNKSSLERLAMLRKKGATTSFSELFRPQSLSATSGFNKFVHEDVVLDFLKVIDGAKNDTNVLGFLDNELIKKGKLCRHIVMVLPYCASCDAMEKLIKSNSEVFRNLSEYEILNISGIKRAKRFQKTPDVKHYIAKCELEGKRTITLTVNRMLTGNTVPQWDTMLFLKQSSSPEEYDQAIFRLQNPYIDEYEDNGHIIKYNLKPQTILVDFDPERVFRLQERKSQIYNVNTENNGNSKLRERIETELRISPIITLDHNKLRKATATDVMAAVLNYANTRSVLDEASDMPIDMSLLNNPELRQVIESLNEIDPKKGIVIPAYRKTKDKEGENIEPDVFPAPPSENSKPSTSATDETPADNSIAKKFASYYALILFFAFLTEDKVLSLEEIIRVIGESENNIRLSRHLGLSADILNIIQTNSNGFALSKLDYKIEKLNALNFDDNKEPLERVKTALTKFGRMSDSEIVTPIHVADEMVKLLPDTVLSKGPILDIASKQGEFTIALLRRFGSSVSDKIYSVCTSPLAYEFTRKVYKMLSLPIDHIFDSFTSYDLIKKDKDNQFIIPKEITAMNFATVIGNPPYQETTIRTSDEPIYHHFVDMSSNIVNNYMLITPARFLFNAGKTPKAWNNQMLKNEHLQVRLYKQSSSDVFPNVDLKGGVAVIGYDKSANYPPIIHYTTYDKLKTILNKVLSYPDFEAIDSLIFPQNKFNLESLYEDNPQMRKQIGSNGTERRLTTSIFMFSDIFSEHKMPRSYKILGLVSNKRCYRYVQKKYISDDSNIDSYKVIVPKSNGKGVLGEVLSTPTIGEPKLGVTQSFITFGAFRVRSEAEACLKYIRSRFVRTLLGILKVTQDNSKETWRFVPLQDFTEGSDIDWSRSVAEIDAQLYAKYRLTDEEIAFIESMIKPM